MKGRAGIIGGGAWGTALAHLIAGKGVDVLLWAREKEAVQSINLSHENEPFLRGISLHEKVRATSSLEEAFRDRDLVICAVPAQFVRPVLEMALPFWPRKTIVVSVSKGIETATLKLLKDVYEEIIPGTSKRQLAFLSGPNFAREIAQGMPAAATVASLSEETAQKAQEFISTPFYKLYASSDIIGVEIGGAVKNVIAIAAGIVEGMGLGRSTLASMMTRGLNEMTRLGTALGAQPLTFLGLSGLGDLILTCTGDLSRNRTLGIELAGGRSRDEILKSRTAVTEGVATAAAVHQLGVRFGIDLPICEEVYRILYEGKACAEAVRDIAARELKEELEGISLFS